MGVVHGSMDIGVEGPVHVADFGGRRDGPLALCVHGLGASSAGWAPLAAALAPSHRVLAVDLPGHGRSPAAGRSVTVPDAAAVLGEVVARLGVGPVTLVAHSMGAVVSVLAASERPSLVGRLLLLAPPMPRQGLGSVNWALLPHAALCLWPRLGRLALERRLAREGIEAYVVDRLRLTCPSLVDLPAVAASLAADLQAAYDSGEDPILSFLQAARSVGILVADGRDYRQALARVHAPAIVVQGALDRVVRPSGLEQLAAIQPSWETHVLPGVGHSPHLEAPLRLATLMDPSRRAAEPAPARRPTVRAVAPASLTRAATVVPA